MFCPERSAHGRAGEFDIHRNNINILNDFFQFFMQDLRSFQDKSAYGSFLREAKVLLKNPFVAAALLPLNLQSGSQNPIVWKSQNKLRQHPFP